MIYLEILSPVPTTYRQCQRCETLYEQSGIGAKVQQEILREYPAEMEAEYRQLSAWIAAISQQYSQQIMIRLIDPQSGLGLWKSLRYWVRQYPAFIVNGKTKYIGWDRHELDGILQKAISHQENR
jgi:hypothetical protein